MRELTQQVADEKESALLHEDIRRKMLRYIAFVLTGDENSDAQLAADKIKETLISYGDSPA